MASLGTLAAELKLDGAAGMMAGLRAVGGAVSSLGDVLTGVRAPLAHLDGALRALQVTGSGTGAAVSPVRAAGEAIRQLPGQASQAAVALQSLGQAGAGMLAAFARPAALKDLAASAGRLPGVAQRLRWPGRVLSPAGAAPARQGELAPQMGLARAGASLAGPAGEDTPATARQQHPVASGGGDFARGLRGVLAQFKSGLPAGNHAAGAERRGPGKAGATLAALLGQFHAAAAGRTRDAAASPGARIDLGTGGVGEGDRLARVGGFIGTGGGPALDYHRRTAAATEKSAQTLQTLVAHWAGSDAAQPAALWS